MGNITTTNYDKAKKDLDDVALRSYDGGSGVGSKSNVEKLARDYVNSNYDKFTKGDDYASLTKRYSDQGRRAMDDTIGQVAARTGGMASSYAASAGQQAYGDWMSGLEDAARSLYDSQQAERLNKLGVAQGLYDRNYSEWDSQRTFDYDAARDNVTYAQYEDEVVNTKKAQAQQDVLALWASGGTPTLEQLQAAGWAGETTTASEGGEVPYNNIGQVYYDQANAQYLKGYMNNVYASLYNDENYTNMTWDDFKNKGVPEGFTEADFNMTKQQVANDKAAERTVYDFNYYRAPDYEPTHSTEDVAYMIDNNPTNGVIRDWEYYNGQSYYGSKIDKRLIDNGGTEDETIEKLFKKWLAYNEDEALDYLYNHEDESAPLYQLYNKFSEKNDSEKNKK